MGRSIHDDEPIPGDRGKLALTYPNLNNEIMEELDGRSYVCEIPCFQDPCIVSIFCFVFVVLGDKGFDLKVFSE